MRNARSITAVERANWLGFGQLSRADLIQFTYLFCNTKIHESEACGSGVDKRKKLKRGRLLFANPCLYSERVVVEVIRV